MDENEVYCRIENGVIVEYPVYAVHIRNRAHPFEMYTKVHFAAKPTLPEFAYYTQNIELLGEIPLVTYGIAYKNLQTLLNELHNVGAAGAPGTPGEQPTPTPIEDVPQTTLVRVMDLAKEMVQDRLDNWAKTRGYDGIMSVVTYAYSSNPVRSAEGTKAIANRDDTWDAMYAYMDKVTTKQLPVPMTVAEISAQLPELTW